MAELHTDRPADANGEANWASLQCLTLVARQHGLHLTPEQLIHDNQISASTVLGARELQRCAEKAGLKGKRLVLSWRQLTRLGRALPAILFFTEGRPMVLREVHSMEAVERVVLQDPALPEDAPLVLDRVQLETVWGGRALLLKRDYSLREEDQPFGFGFMAALIVREKRLLRDITICALFLSVLTLVPLLMFRLMTDRVLAHHAMSTFTVLCIAMALAAVFETIFSATRRALLTHLTSRVDAKMSVLIFERIIRMPIEVFEKYSVGEIARSIGEATKVRDFFTRHLFGTALDSLTVVLILPVMFIVSPLLTFIILACCLVSSLWIAALLPAFGRRTRDVIAADSARGSFLIQSLQGIRTIKSLALEPRHMQKFEVLVSRSIRAREREAGLANVIQSALLPVERFMLSGTLAIGVYIAMTVRDTTAVAEIFMFLLLSQRVAVPLKQLAHLVEQYEDARGAAGSVSAMINVPPEGFQSSQGVRKALEGRLVFSSVRFQYKGSTSPALNEVSFEVPAGTTLGIMGRSGSGKTTVTRLLQRLHDEYDGLIKIDGIDVREYALDHLRSSLGVVLQDNFLFSGTIRENITAAKVDASFDEVVRAARLAGAEEFIDRLPRGYETWINEGSSNLSGGQRQRIAIARALITNPRILILDEATSALDPDSEAIVNANLKRISEGRTVIVISHRLSSLVTSDSILVLERGRVHDIGKHAELLDRCEIYRDLWNQQNAQVQEHADVKLRLVS